MKRCARSSNAITTSLCASENNDTVIDQFEVEVDELAIQLLAKAPLASDLRFVTVAMKISQNLERVGDEASKIAKRGRDLSQEPPVKVQVDLPRIAKLALDMLKAALDSFVNRDPAAARAIIPRDKEVDDAEQTSHESTRGLHAGKPRYDQTVSEPDYSVAQSRTHCRPRQERRGGGCLFVRGSRHSPPCQGPRSCDCTQCRARITEPVQPSAAPRPRREDDLPFAFFPAPTRLAAS